MTDTRRSIAYARVSTRQQADSGLGLDAQLERGRAFAVAHGYVPVEDAVDAGVSGAAAPDSRPALAAALAALDAGEAHVLVAASLSRLGRKVSDVLALADRAKRNGWALAVLDLGLDTNTAVGRFALTTLAAVAELEREQVRERTRSALAAAKRRGVRLGHATSPRTRKAGAVALQLREQGTTWEGIARALEAGGFKRARGSTTWTRVAAYKVAGAVRRDREAAAAREAHNGRHR